jgi:hypothetical protein
MSTNQRLRFWKISSEMFYELEVKVQRRTRRSGKGVLPRKPALAISDGKSGHLRKLPADFKWPVSKRFDEPRGDFSSEKATIGEEDPAGASPWIKSDSSGMEEACS